MERHIVVIAHDIRSTHNVGSLFRTCEGLGVKKIYLTGYTPYPLAVEDKRLPHLAYKIDSQIHKTALGAEKTLPWAKTESVETVIKELKRNGYEVVALEQTAKSLPLREFRPGPNVAILMGNEVTGLPARVIADTDKQVEIPMRGKKESFNVVIATAIAAYHCSNV